MPVRNQWPLILGLFFTADLGLLVLFNTGLEIQSAARAYVSGEGLYSKSQRDAVGHLRDFAESRNEADYRLYQAAIAVPLGDRAARVEMEQPEPDLAKVDAGLTRGGNHPADLTRMFWLFRTFRHVTYMGQAIDTWTAADARVGSLQAAAERLDREIAAEPARPEGVRLVLSEIAGINADLAVLEDSFSSTLGDAARWVQSVVLVAEGLGSAMLLGAGAFGTWRIMRQVGRSQADYRGLVDTAGDAVIAVDVYDRIVLFNPAAELIFDQTAQVALGRPLEELLVLPARLELVARPSTEPQLATGRRRDGTVFEAECGISRSNYGGGRGQTFIVRDVTQRRRAQEALQASEERFRRQYKGIPLPTYSWRQDGDDFVLEDYNDAAEAIVGHGIREWIGVLASIRYAAEPSIVADLRACVAEQHTLRREVRYRFPDTGAVRDLAVTYVFVPPLTVMIHTEDLTEAKRAEQQREAMAQSEKLRALGQMASGIAHDLNQSLMLVASYSELARQALVHDPPDLVELEDLLTTSTQAALDGGESVKRLLMFTRAAPERVVQIVDLGNVVREAAQLAAPRWRDAPQAEGRPISLDLETVGHPSVQGSPAQLREMLTNLIFNAVDALPVGGTIRLRVAAEDMQGIIEVVDSGVGMSVEVQQRVFEPFFTTKGEDGTGLGLAMVFGIVGQHGGQIGVRSAPGAGTTFRIAFPLVAAPADSAPLPGTPAPLARARPLRVLVVDDEPMMTKAVARMLRPSGHLVTAAASGEEALTQLSEHTYDVVVSDMGMGAGMNGWELAEAAKRRWPGVRFMLATGWGAAIDPAEARAKGVEAVLSKPYHPADLLHALGQPDEAGLHQRDAA